MHVCREWPGHVVVPVYVDFQINGNCLEQEIKSRRAFIDVKIHYKLMPDWPCLVWFATLVRGDNAIRVQHGSQVETQDAWFCEAIWDGDFECGNFDKTDIVFGSGCRTRENHAVFVSSNGVSDRLHHHQKGSESYVSNSLACLVSVLDLDIDPWYPDYYRDFFSICDGIDHYKSELQTESGPVYLTYHRNLIWNGDCLVPAPKPFPNRDFSTFEGYRGFLVSSLEALADNMRANGRNTTYKPISTASSGYDSLAVTILTREINNRDVICFETSRQGRDDNGEASVTKLGFDALVFQRTQWRKHAFAEIPFIAADACGRDAVFMAAKEALPQRVLFSGFHGGAAWKMQPPNTGSNFARTDNAGLSQTEYRLQVGYLHCPVPVIGARQCSQIADLSQSPVMEPWSVGGGYDRPIPRRIIEEAGIDRSMFGFGKRATGLHLFRKTEFMQFMPGSESFHDYMTWIRLKSRKSRPTDNYDNPKMVQSRIEVPLFEHLFPWALERMKPVFTEVADKY